MRCLNNKEFLYAEGLKAHHEYMSTTIYETQAFVEKIKTLDRETLHELVREYTGQLRRAGLGMGLKAEEADELVQNTWTTFFEVAERFEGRSKIRTFLFGIMYNKVRELRRDINKHGHEQWDEFESRFDETGHWVKRPENPEVFAERSQTIKHLEDCMEKLPVQQRTAFNLREVQDLTTEEVSQIMGISANNLGVLAFRAKANLRECLEAK